MSEPTLGHLDPDFVAIMDETTELLRYVFNTQNRLTIPISGTGSAGMEAALVNSVEPGDKAIICTCGIFGDRMLDVAERAGAEVIKVEAPWGSPIDPEDVKNAIRKHPDAKIVGLVYAETSTGVLQPLEEIATMAHEKGMRLVVDAVTALGGVGRANRHPVAGPGLLGYPEVLELPAGLAPITLNDKAVEFVSKRTTKCRSWYLDLGMIQRYWGSERFYHHTAPINMIYALHEALLSSRKKGWRTATAGTWRLRRTSSTA
jgi:alanine-glyoxylate transaminase/serine-glyoxylate transaminase/serine-pyruvate transaminase